MAADNIEESQHDKKHYQKPNLYQIFINDLWCGSLAGLAYILSAHPLDSIKVRM